MSCIPVSPFVSQRKVWVGNLVNTGQEVHQEEEVQEEEEEEGEEEKEEDGKSEKWIYDKTRTKEQLHKETKSLALRK